MQIHIYITMLKSNKVLIIITGGEYMEYKKPELVEVEVLIDNQTTPCAMSKGIPTRPRTR